MHETHPIEFELKEEARRLSAKYHGAPVVIVVAGQGMEVPRSMTASSFERGKSGRLRDLLGILNAACQIESLKHFGLLGKD